jgi:hypothetical protein
MRCEALSLRSEVEIENKNPKSEKSTRKSENKIAK